MGAFLTAYGKPLGLGVGLLAAWVGSALLADDPPAAAQERGTPGVPAATADSPTDSSAASGRARKTRPYVAGPVADGGTIRVRCVLAKAVQVVEVPLNKDQGPSKCGHDRMQSERVVFDPSSLALTNCVVWIDDIAAGKDFEGAMAKRDQEITLDQKGCRYVPHVMLARQGARLWIKNSDPVEHNIQGAYKDKSRTAFNPFSSSGSLLPPVDDTTLTKAGTWILGCSIHPWMSGYIWTVAHPYYGITGSDGTVALLDVPPGEHTVACWHEGMEMTVETKGIEITAYKFSPDLFLPPQKVTVTPGATVEIVFTIDPPR